VNGGPTCFAKSRRDSIGADSLFQHASEPATEVYALGAQQLAILRLAFCSRPDKFPLVAETEIDWPEALPGSDQENSAAIGALRGFLLNGLRVALRDRQDVSEAQLEDFTQEALLRILNRLDQFEGRSKFTTWAYAIAVNAAFAELRRKRWQDVSLETLLADGARLGDPDIMPNTAFGGDEDRDRLVVAFRRAIQEATHGKATRGHYWRTARNALRSDR
jgi:RNA polymerase sigma factor (sigma-70 family)